MNPIGSRIERLNGLILSGGKSLRYGQPKQELDFHGLPQKNYLFQLLGYFCEAVFLSVNREANDTDFPQILDLYPSEGPLNGILSAFHTYPDRAWLCVACDLPGTGPMSLSRLVSQRRPEKMATCYYDSDGLNPEPLLSLWEPRALPALLSYYENHGNSPREFLTGQDIHCVEALSIRHLFNINSPEDHEKWKKL